MYLFQLRQYLDRQPGHAVEIEAAGYYGVVVAAVALDFSLLALQITGVLDRDLHLFGGARVINPWADALDADQIAVQHLGAAQQVECGGFTADRETKRCVDRAPERIGRGSPQRAQACGFCADRIALAAHRIEPFRRYTAERATVFGQAHVGVVLAQMQAIFGARGEHAVGLDGAVADQVVDQHADVRLVATRCPRLVAAYRSGCVEAGDQALCGRFLVAGGAVDLAGEVEPGHRFGFQRRLEAAWIEIVVLDRIARARDVRFFETADRAHQIELHVERQRGRDAVRINLRCLQAFGLDEYLMRGLVGEAHHLVLDRRAVARAGALDHAAVQRRAIQRATDDVVGTLGGMRDPATDLARVVGDRAFE